MYNREISIQGIHEIILLQLVDSIVNMGLSLISVYDLGDSTFPFLLPLGLTPLGHPY